ncbi:MAG: mechanosensitive ion channel family protein [Acholeplasmatales bacterium]|nr:mechanosensitive ion channel family protein [Acholeplasmatales bacterium]
MFSINTALIRLMEETETTETTTEETTTSVDLTSKDWWLGKWEDLKEWATTKGVRYLLAFFVMLICLKIIDLVCKRFYKRLIKRQADATISKVFVGIASKALKLVVFLMFLAYIGIETASVSAIIAACSVGLGLAVQGALSNFAGGILIILTRPFRIGDYIEAQGKAGTVEDIHLFYTEVVTVDNVINMIPNGILANGVITNKSMKDTRRVDEVFPISYDTDFAKAEAIIIDICKKNKLVFTDPAPFCRISNYGDSSIDLTCRVWVKASDYWDVHFYLLEEVKKAFDLNNIEIPYNKMDLYVINKNQEAPEAIEAPKKVSVKKSTTTKKTATSKK